MTCRLHTITLALLCLALTSAFGPASTRSNKKANLPTFDDKTQKFVPPPNVSSGQFYSPISSMIKAGPVPAITRLFSPQEYEQAVWKYMVESKEPDIKQAQGNMDAFFASRELWVEQKMLEQMGKREVFDYGKEPGIDRVVLASVWGVMSTSILARATWQLIHGNRNLF